MCVQACDIVYVKWSSVGVNSETLLLSCHFPVVLFSFSLWQVDLTFSDGALAAIADEAAKMKTGARGLRSIMVCFFNDSILQESW